MKILLVAGLVLIWTQCAVSEVAGYYLGVSCAEVETQKLLEQSLSDAFKALSPQTRVTHELSQAAYGLWVTAEKNRDNPKNPEGYAIAVAYTHSGIPRVLAKMIGQRKSDSHRATESKMIPQLVDISPPLIQLSATGLEKLNPETAKSLSLTLVKAFLARTPH